MNKKDIMFRFIKKINDDKMTTNFIKNIFGYENFFDYNYLFRMINGDNEIIIDIYDNVSDNRFNRYIFFFDECDYSYYVIEEGNVFVNYISVLNIYNIDNNLLRLAKLFNIDNNDMIMYAGSFLDRVFVNMLKDIIK